eukprot:m.84709 g.84709  ORF g.84709 m.84709 type:complete len:776 (-) comp8716_c0_seq9:280-2607(-)
MVGGNKLSSTYKLLVALAGTVVITLFVLNQSSREPDYHQDLGEDANKIFNAIEGINNADNPLLERDHDSHQGKRTPTLNIFCFAFNRPNDFSWLWQNLMHAKPSGIRTKIVIHVDFDKDNSEGWQEQVRIASQLSGSESVHGPVTSVFATSPRGLKATMLEAWAPIRGEYAMFLEDDIDVSEMLLVYAEKFIMAYGESSQKDPTVLGYKLYNQKWDEVNQRFEEKVDNGYAPFKIQEPCSWGTVFIAEPYKRYLAWFMENYESDPMIPHAWSNTWDAKKSAKKYLQRFMWEEGLFLISINFPRDLSLVSPSFSKEEPLLTNRWSVPLLTERELEGSSLLLIFPPSSNTFRSFSFDRAEVIVMKKFELKDVLSDQAMRFRLFEGVGEELQMKLSGETFSCNFDWSWIEVEQMKQEARKFGWSEQSLPKSGDALCVLLRSLQGSESGRMMMVVHVHWGLGSRLRALSSALLLAKSTMRWPVVVWVPDNHCEANLTDVLDIGAIPGISIFNSSTAIESIIQKDERSWNVWDILKVESSTAKYSMQRNKHIYTISQKSLNFVKQWSYLADNIYLRQMVLHPSKMVQGKIQNLLGSVSEKNVLGLHIRMRKDVFEEVGSMDSKMLQAVPFRISCDWNNFAQAMQEKYSKEALKGKAIFIASDSQEAIVGIKQMFPSSSIIGFSACTSREVDCVQEAMASIAILSRSKVVFGSKWSAMSEIAIRAGSHSFQFGCEMPNGEPWDLSSSSLRHQVESYLETKEATMSKLPFSVNDIANAFLSK